MKNTGKILFDRFLETDLEAYESYYLYVSAKAEEIKLLNKMPNEQKQEILSLLSLWSDFFVQKGLDLVYYIFKFFNEIFNLNLNNLP